MDPTQIIAAIDALVKLGTFVNNAVGSDSKVGAIIAARIADGGRDWTDAERQQITDDIAANKAYAKQQADLPD